MAYDDELADRIRELLAGEKGVTEKRMFGGLAFLIGGTMAVSASGKGGVMVRVDPATSEKLVATTKARFMVMRGREMQGGSASTRPTWPPSGSWPSGSPSARPTRAHCRPSVS